MSAQRAREGEGEMVGSEREGWRARENGPRGRERERERLCPERGSGEPRGREWEMERLWAQRGRGRGKARGPRRRERERERLWAQRQREGEIEL